MSNTVERRFYVRRPEKTEFALTLDQVKHLETEVSVEGAEEGQPKAIRTAVITEELVHEACGRTGQWHSVTIKTPWTRKDRSLLEAEVTSISPMGQSIRDNERAVSVLVARAVTSWTLRRDNLDPASEPLPVSADSFDGLSDSLADVIHNLVESVCYPSKFTGTDFFLPSVNSGVSGSP